MNFDIRPAQPEDAGDLLAILNEALSFKLSVGDKAWELEPWTLKEVNHSIDAGSTYLARLGDTAVASVILVWDDERTWGEIGLDGQAGYLHRMAVRDAYRGQQLGKKIVDWATEQVRSHERKYLRLDCPANNQKLSAYYENIGFSKIDTSKTTSFYQLAV
jgi:ribosomal protein S18 acetylase RimI-like enzyme